MPTKKPRITAIVEPETKAKVKAISKKEGKSESFTAGRLLEDGLKLVDNGKINVSK